MKRYLISILLSLGLILSGFAQSNDQIDFVNIGDQVPDFTLRSTAHGNISSDMLKGKVTLISIFATWCGPCQKELAALQKAIDHQTIPWAKDNKDLAILVVGREHNENQLEAYNSKKGFTFPIYPDPSREFTSKFAKQNIPRTYLVNRDGKIVFSSVGFDNDEFNKLINLIHKELNKQ